MILIIALIGLGLLSACAPQPMQITIPTAASLPTQTEIIEPLLEQAETIITTIPTPDDAIFPTVLLAPTDTPFVNLQTEILEILSAATVEITVEPTAEDAHMQTVFAQVTQINQTAYAEISQTAAVTRTAEARLGTSSLYPVPPQGYYARRRSGLYECPNQSCAALAQLEINHFVVVDGVIEAEMLEDENKIWYRATYNNLQGYIYSLYLIPAPPGAELTNQIQVASPISTQPANLPPIGMPNTGGATCPSMQSTCSQLTCEQAYACLAAGLTRLDNNGNGVPCEAVCR